MTKEKNTKEKAGNIVSTRGRTFKGKVVKKFSTRVVVEFERTVYVPKYESFYRKKTRVHSRLPEGMDVNVGDMVLVRETRPLSKIIHSMVVEKISSGKEASK